MISSTELAEACGVSQGTVDRALHDRAGISPKTKARILAKAAELGFQINPSARELITGQCTIVLGLVEQVNSLFFMDLFHAVAEALRVRGLRLHICPYSNADEFKDTLRDFAARRARGALFIPPRYAVDDLVLPAYFQMLSLVNESCLPNAVTIMPDEHNTGYAAARGLIERGHSKIVMVDYAHPSATAVDRQTGYTAAMENAGERARILTAPTPEVIMTAISEGVTALFCHNDWLALRMIREMGAQGVRIPEDLSVLGVDDSPGFVGLYDDITTMHYPFVDIAAHAAARLDGDAEIPDIGDCHWVERTTVRHRACTD